MPVFEATKESKTVSKRKKAKIDKTDAEEADFLSWRSSSDKMWASNFGHVESMRNFQRLLVDPMNQKEEAEQLTLL